MSEILTSRSGYPNKSNINRVSGGEGSGVAEAQTKFSGGAGHRVGRWKECRSGESEPHTECGFTVWFESLAGTTNPRSLQAAPTRCAGRAPPVRQQVWGPVRCRYNSGGCPQSDTGEQNGTFSVSLTVYFLLYFTILYHFF